MSRNLLESVTTAIGRVLPTARVTVSRKVVGYKGRPKVKLATENGAIKVIVHDQQAGKKDIYVRVDKRRQALKAIRAVFSEQQIPLAA